MNSAIKIPGEADALPTCSFGNNVGACNDGNLCFSVGAAPLDGTEVEEENFSIEVAEKFYEIKRFSPYEITIEARNQGGDPIGDLPSPPGLRFIYQVSDVFPR